MYPSEKRIASWSQDALLEAIRSDNSILSTTDSHGLSPLHYFALAGCIDAVKEAISLGANVNAGRLLPDPQNTWLEDHKMEVTGYSLLVKGSTPLHAAVLSYQFSHSEELALETIRVLQTSGAEVPQDVTSPSFIAALIGFTAALPLFPQITEAQCAMLRLNYLGEHVKLYRTKVAWTLEQACAFAGCLDTSQICDKTDPSLALFALAGGHIDLGNALICANGDPTSILRRSDNTIGATTLHHAAWCGDVGLVTRCLGSGVKTAVRDKARRTPLMLACAKGNSEIVQLLLQEEAQTAHKDTKDRTASWYAARYCHPDILSMVGTDDSVVFAAAAGGCNELITAENYNSVDSNGRTPLHFAAKHNQCDTVRHILSFGAEIDPISKSGQTPLYSACREAYRGASASAEILLAAGASLSREGAEPPILGAIYGHSIPMIQTLLDNGAELTQTSSDGWGVLHTAVETDNTDILRYFLEKGADPNAATTKGQTPLTLAARMGLVEASRVLLENKALPDFSADQCDSPLVVAICFKQTDIVRLLIEYKATVDCGPVDIALATTLMENDDDETLNVLLKSGLSPNKTLSGGLTLLQLAVSAGAQKVVSLLCSNGADVSRHSKDTAPPLLLAANHGFSEIALSLLNAGASPQVEYEEQFPLLVAAASGQVSVLSVLKEHGADLEQCDAAGHTALAWAAAQGEATVITELLHLGANIRVTDLDGRTPLHIAALNQHKAACVALLTEGADPLTPDSEGVTPMELSRQSAELGRVFRTQRAAVPAKPKKAVPGPRRRR